MIKKISFMFLIILTLCSLVIADSYEFQSYYSGDSQMISSNSYGVENSPFSSHITKPTEAKITGSAILEEEGKPGIGLFIFVCSFIIFLGFLMLLKRKYLKSLLSFRKRRKKRK